MLDIQDIDLNTPKIKQEPVHFMYTEDNVLSDLWAKKLAGMSLREISSYYPGTTHADIQRALRGEFPKTAKKRACFGLPVTGNIIYMYGELPGGEPVSIGAQECECGQWFISNHPRRSKCFICSPYKGKRK